MSAENSIGFQDYPAPIGAVMYWAGKSRAATASAPTAFAIASIVGTAMTTTGSPPLSAGMVISGTGITIGTYIVSGSVNSWVISYPASIAPPGITGTFYPLPYIYRLPYKIQKGGWIIPEGQSLSKAEYNDLWYLQQSLGAVDAGDTFLAPDLTTPLPTPATLGYNFLLPTQLIAGNTINTDFGILPPTITASATLTQANLPIVALDYAPNSLQYQATFINPVAGQTSNLYTSSSTTNRTGGEDYKYVRDDTTFINTNIINQFANLNKYTLTYENLNPPTPINATGQINPPLAPLVVPPHVELMPLMKASYSTILPPTPFPPGYTELPY